MCQAAQAGSRARRIADAIHPLRESHARAMRVEIAQAARRLSSFRRRFRLVASLSPLQVQQPLRLLEARRLVVAESPP